MTLVEFSCANMEASALHTFFSSHCLMYCMCEHCRLAKVPNKIPDPVLPPIERIIESRSTEQNLSIKSHLVSRQYLHYTRGRNNGIESTSYKKWHYSELDFNEEKHEKVSTAILKWRSSEETNNPERLHFPLLTSVCDFSLFFYSHLLPHELVSFFSVLQTTFNRREGAILAAYMKEKRAITMAEWGCCCCFFPLREQSKLMEQCQSLQQILDQEHGCGAVWSTENIVSNSFFDWFQKPVTLDQKSFTTKTVYLGRLRLKLTILRFSSSNS